MYFKFTIEHVPGKSIGTADTLSRAPVPHSLSSEDLNHQPDEQIESHVNTVLQQLQKEQEADDLLSQVKQYCERSWPEAARHDNALKPYWASW